MSVILWICRILTSAIFAVSGIAKLAHPSGTKKALAAFRVPAALTPLGAALLPLVELATSAALLWNRTAWWGAMAAVSLFGLFSIVIAITVIRGERPDCHCFGQIASQPISGSMIVRNGVLAAPAMFIVLAPYLRPIEAMLAVICTLLAIGLAYALVTIRRLSKSVNVMEKLFDASDVATHRRASDGQTAAARGLPIGAVAPDFTLPAARGEELSLEALLSRGKPLVLWFGSPTCGPCKELLPEIAQWRERLGDRYAIVGFLRGTAEENALIVESHPHLELAFVGNTMLADAYRAPWTPAAVVVSPEGRIDSGTAFGVDAIRALITQRAELEPARSAKTIPELPAIAADGRKLDRDALLARAPLAVMFWSTSCSYCNAIAKDLERWAASRPPRAPSLLIVQSGAEVPARRFGAAMVHDVDGSISRELGSAGTPSAFLVDRDGTIVSDVLAGGDDVRALLGIHFEAR